MAQGKRGTPNAASSVHRGFGMLRTAFSDAVRSDRIAVSPVRGIDLPKLASERLNPPTPAQVSAILDAAPEPYEAALALCAFGGLRRSEALALRWSDVDLTERVLYVRQALSFVGRELTFDRPKSRDSERAVPMAPQLVEVLQSAKADQAARRLRLGQGWKDLDLVCDNGTGSAMHPERLSQERFASSPAVSAFRARLHDLRHASITVQLAAGVPLVVASKVAGHSSTAFTARVYSPPAPRRPALGSRRDGTSVPRGG